MHAAVFFFSHEEMKQRDLLRHVHEHRCELLREGSSHSWWHNLDQNWRTAVPRHSEINDIRARKICRDLGITQP